MSKHKNRSFESRDRRAQFEHPPASRLSPNVVVAVAGAVFAVVLVYAMASSGRGTAGTDSSNIAPVGADLSLPLSTFADGAARFYRYTTAAGREVRFFVMKSSDGVVRAAFDACDTCYRDKRGYHQQGDVMVCNKCSRTFPSNEINVLRGGCNPSPLERTVAGDQVVLKAADLERGALYF